MTTTLIPATIGFVMQGNTVALGIKKKKVAAGYLSSAGGKIDPGQTELSCLQHEVLTEWGITICTETVQKMGIVDFYNTQPDGSSFNMRVHVYKIPDWHGTPIETDEMGAPTFYPLNEVPYHKMMVGDRDWVQWVLSDKRVRATVRYRVDRALACPVQIRLASEKDFDLLRYHA